MTRMAGKVVLITGAGKGMGRTHAVRLAEEGADILAIDLPGSSRRPTWPRPRASCGNWAAARSPHRGHPGPRRAHRGRAGGRARAGPARHRRRQRGICDKPGPSWTIDDDIWNRSIDVNVTGTWHTVKAGVAELNPDGGSVVIVSSTAAIKAVPGASHYSAAKHAITGLSKDSRETNWAAVDPRQHDSPRRRRDADDDQSDDVRPSASRPREPDRADVAEVLSQRMLLPVPWWSRST